MCVKERPLLCSDEYVVMRMRGCFVISILGSTSSGQKRRELQTLFKVKALPNLRGYAFIYVFYSQSVDHKDSFQYINLTLAF